MNTDKDFEIKIAEGYGNISAVIESLQTVITKIEEDKAERTTKAKDSLKDLRIKLNFTADMVVAIRQDLDETLEKCIITAKDLNNIDVAIRKLSAIRTKLEDNEITVTDCRKWFDDVDAIKTALEKRYQIKKVDSEKQASVASLTEQLKQKDSQIEQLTAKVQELQKQLEPKKDN
jgi:uncharacterized coiled-coil DUF342 family protein